MKKLWILVLLALIATGCESDVNTIKSVPPNGEKIEGAELIEYDQDLLTSHLIEEMNVVEFFEIHDDYLEFLEHEGLSIRSEKELERIADDFMDYLEEKILREYVLSVQMSVSDRRIERLIDGYHNEEYRSFFIAFERLKMKE